jgi:hypothetical protein
VFFIEDGVAGISKRIVATAAKQYQQKAAKRQKKITKIKSLFFAGMKRSSLLRLTVNDGIVHWVAILVQSRIFSCVRPYYERVVSNLDRSMHISLWV